VILPIDKTVQQLALSRPRYCIDFSNCLRLPLQMLSPSSKYPLTVEIFQVFLSRLLWRRISWAAYCVVTNAAKFLVGGAQAALQGLFFSTGLFFGHGCPGAAPQARGCGAGRGFEQGRVTARMVSQQVNDAPKSGKGLATWKLHYTSVPGGVLGIQLTISNRNSILREG
jgi:hypothetical protein